ncbi:unnamed protein product [Acanthoscelides obtectus]|nr:unnamed protein product [Acanthoscelides obtectus]CAH1982047.1 unnamed protein product [Acanthoscelides obtectus]CAH1990519.1 unnamed protein product [Acanthoscelides obtectus]CAH1993526.1 unnamed protein product [Acanthoscelides obtectus]CAH1995341.1 unnamed protein product [Acanthoscelides obtectus]
MKRIIFNKDNKGVVKVKMELNFRIDDTSKQFESIAKRGRHLKAIKLNKKELKNKVKEDKLKNLKTLLFLYDENWQHDERLAFFKDFLAECNVGTTIPESDSDDGFDCDCNEEDGGVAI